MYKCEENFVRVDPKYFDEMPDFRYADFTFGMQKDLGDGNFGPFIVDAAMNDPWIDTFFQSDDLSTLWMPNEASAHMPNDEDYRIVVSFEGETYDTMYYGWITMFFKSGTTLRLYTDTFIEEFYVSHSDDFWFSPMVETVGMCEEERDIQFVSWDSDSDKQIGCSLFVADERDDGPIATSSSGSCIFYADSLDVNTHYELTIQAVLEDDGE
jgi:hypothetical protein